MFGLLVWVCYVCGMKNWNYESYWELSELVGEINALKNGWYDTHNLEGIEKDREEIEEKITYLTSLLPVPNSTIGDYEWDFTENKLIYLK